VAPLGFGEGRHGGGKGCPGRIALGLEVGQRLTQAREQRRALKMLLLQGVQQFVAFMRAISQLGEQVGLFFRVMQGCRRSGNASM
jgi:hypothetical protein